MSRPAAPLPTWATDENYTSGPDNGTATKLEPSTGQLAQGWVPGTLPPAQWMNWAKNKFGDWIGHLSRDQHSNWDPININDVTDTARTGGALVRVHLQYSRALGLWFQMGELANNDKVYISIDDGTLWAPRTTGSAGELVRCGTEAANGYFVLAGQNNVWRTNSADASSWATVSLPGGTSRQPTDAAFDIDNVRSVIVGSNDGAPSSWRSTDGGATWTQGVQSGGTPQRVIFGNGLFVSVTFGAGAASVRYSSDGLNWTDTVQAFNNVLDIAYSDTEDLWMIVTSDAEVFVSSDPTSGAWTQVATLAVALRTIAVNGSLWIGGLLGLSSYAYSTDRGLTWHAGRLYLGTYTWNETTYANGRFMHVLNTGAGNVSTIRGSIRRATPGVEDPQLSI